MIYSRLKPVRYQRLGEDYRAVISDSFFSLISTLGVLFSFLLEIHHGDNIKTK